MGSGAGWIRCSDRLTNLLPLGTLVPHRHDISAPCFHLVVQKYNQPSAGAAGGREREARTVIACRGKGALKQSPCVV